MRIAAITASLLLATALTASAVTDTIVIDENTQGTVFDGIVDGFPGLAPRDGTADFGGNPLSVARQADVTETRAVMEFPLAAVAGQPIVSAKLVFNVDDVITLRTPLPEERFHSSAAIEDLSGRTLERIRGIPNVEAAASTCCIPLQQSWGLVFKIIGRDDEGRPFTSGGDGGLAIRRRPSPQRSRGARQRRHEQAPPQNSGSSRRHTPRA